MKNLMYTIISIIIFSCSTSIKKPQVDINKVQEEQFKEYISNVMELVKKDKPSLARKQLLINKIYNTTTKYIEQPEARQAFVILLFNETKFRHNSKSSVGAVGISQLMPKYFLGFAKTCNIQVVQEDINDLDINLEVGACHFNHLVKLHKNMFVALAAYNSGPQSETVSKLKNFENINNETSNYVLKYGYVQSLVSK